MSKDYRNMSEDEAADHILNEIKASNQNSTMDFGKALAIARALLNDAKGDDRSAEEGTPADTN